MLMRKPFILTITGMLLLAGTALADGTAETNSHSGHGSAHEDSQPAATAAVTASTSPSTTAAPASASAAATPAATPSPHEMGHEADSHAGHSQSTPAASAEPSEPAAAGGHSHGSGEELVETPANVPVLGGFAALNGAFLLIGAWNKLGQKRKREGAHRE